MADDTNDNDNQHPETQPEGADLTLESAEDTPSESETPEGDAPGAEPQSEGEPAAAEPDTGDEPAAASEAGNEPEPAAASETEDEAEPVTDRKSVV